MKMETKSEHFFICVIKWNEMRFCGIYVCGALILFMWNGSASASFFIRNLIEWRVRLLKEKIQHPIMSFALLFARQPLGLRVHRTKDDDDRSNSNYRLLFKTNADFSKFLFHLSGTRAYRNGLESMSGSERTGVHSIQSAAYTRIN